LWTQIQKYGIPLSRYTVFLQNRPLARPANICRFLYYKLKLIPNFEFRIPNLLVHVLDYRFESLVKHLGVVKISLELLHRRCVVESVANTLVCNDLECNEVVIFLRSVGESHLLGEHLSVRDEDGEMAEVVKVVVDCGNTQRAH